LSRYELAVKIGVHPNQVYAIETGIQRPTWDRMRQIAAVLNVTMDEFAKPAGPPKRKPKRGRPKRGDA
jgi:transcriptional regulator with XRE-family HTH domain